MMDTSLAATKHRWRRALQAGRLARHAPTAHLFRTNIAALIDTLQPRAVALYVPMPGEPDPGITLGSPPRWLLPRLFATDGSPLTHGVWGWADSGIEQPRPPWPAGPRQSATDMSTVDLVLIAALAVDKSGTRLGKGGGWYDRALHRFHPQAPRLALVFDSEVFPAGDLPRQNHDLPMDGVVTERGLSFFADEEWGDRAASSR